MNRASVVLAVFIVALAEAVLLISSMDYRIALERENDRLRAQLAPKTVPHKDVYNAILCPSGNSISQRIDKRRRDGMIIESKWRRVCT